MAAPAVEALPTQDAPPRKEKLRNSCQACAAAKVKCNKEKPTCSRCRRRKTPCHYCVTKRPGRKGTRHRPPPPSSSSSWVDRRSTLPAWDAADGGSVPDDSVAAITLDNTPLSGVGVFEDDLLSNSEHSLGTAGFVWALEDPVRPLMDASSLPDAMGHGAVDPSGIFSVFANNNKMAPLVSCEALAHPPSQPIHDVTCPTPVSASWFQEHPSTDSGSPEPVRAVRRPSLEVPSESCHAQALRLVRDLTGKKQAGCAGNSYPFSNVHGLPQDAVSENKRVVQAVLDLLDCSCCSDDGALLMTLCLAVMMVLDAYNDAARWTWSVATPMSTAPSSTCSLVSTSMQDSVSRPVSSPTSASVVHQSSLDRSAAKRILGELHRVQRAAREIADRLEAHAEHKMVGGVKGSGRLALLFSVATCKKMTQDLRGCVSVLAKSLIATLREA